jgi:hypothetical protein
VKWSIIFCIFGTIWCAYENVYDPPATYAGLMAMRACGCINGIGGIVGCLMTMAGLQED